MVESGFAAQCFTDHVHSSCFIGRSLHLSATDATAIQAIALTSDAERSSMWTYAVSNGARITRFAASEVPLGGSVEAVRKLA